MRIMFGQYISSASLLHNTLINTIQISDSKLFSMFGLAHKGTEVRKTCNRAYRQLLPDIQEHIQEEPEQKGLTSLICDHVIDVELFIDPSAVDDKIPLLPLA
jgi:hypothetical protein